MPAPAGIQGNAKAPAAPDRPETTRACDRAILLEDGKVVHQVDNYRSGDVIQFPPATIGFTEMAS